MDLPDRLAAQDLMLARPRVWHWITVALVTIVVLLLLWFGIAYGGLPRLWSRHEHKKIGRRDEVISYTAQDIPADPINLHLVGDAGQIGCAFDRAGWTLADNVSVRSGVKIAASVVLGRAYPTAPISSLYVHDRVQDLAFQIANGRSASRRHHVRFWQVAPGNWLGAATYDRGVGFSLFTLQVTHHIGPDVDGERAMIGRIVMGTGARLVRVEPSRITPGRWHRNGGGDRYRTDGLIHVYALGAHCPSRSGSEATERGQP